MVTTLVMDISVIAFCVMPISDTSDHCISDGGFSDDHVGGDNVSDVCISDRFCVMPISDTSDHCISDGFISDDHVSGDNISDVYISDSYMCDAYPRWHRLLHQ